MKLNTQHFGEIEINEDAILEFDLGIPGVLNSKRFILLSDEEVFYWLQSVDQPDIAFVMINVLNYLPDYSPIVDDGWLESLGEYSQEEDLCMYNIVVVPENIQNLSVNLKAPIIINTNTKKGVQVVCNNEEYTVKYFLFEELNKSQDK